jgi:hypothetical protein
MSLEDTEYSVDASNLVPDTSYDAYFVIKSTETAFLSSVEKVDFDTSASTTITTPAPEPPVDFRSRAWDRNKPDYRHAHPNIIIKNKYVHPIDGERLGEKETLHY